MTRYYRTLIPGLILLTMSVRAEACITCPMILILALGPFFFIVFCIGAIFLIFWKSYTAKLIRIACITTFVVIAGQAIRSAAAEIEKDQIPATIEKVRFGNQHEKLDALNALAGVGSQAESVLPLLAETLAKEPDRELRRSAAFAIGGIVSGRRGVTSTELIEGEKSGKYDPNRTYDPASDSAIESLLQAAQNDSFVGVRVQALMSLINIHPPVKRVLPGLLAILSKEKDDTVAGLAHEALGYYPQVPPDAEPELRRAGQAAIPKLLRLVRDGKGQDSLRSLTALGDVHFDMADPKQSQLSHSVVDELASDLPKERDAELRHSIAFTISRIVLKWPDDQKVVGINKLLSLSRPETAYAAKSILDAAPQLRKSSATATQLDVINKQTATPQLPEHPANAAQLYVLLHQVQAGDQQARAMALDGIARPSAGAVALGYQYAALLNSKDGDLRMAAVRGCAGIKAKECVEPL